MRRTLRSTLLLLIVAAAGWLLLTSVAPGAWVASWAPCQRNWAWTPAWQPRVSPLAALPIGFSRGHGKLCYGQPSLRGRTMIGGAAVPYGKLWRTGANEPTTLHLDLPARLGDLALLPGSYSIYTIPGRERWQVIVNRATRQWGIESEYTATVERQEVGRFDVPAERLDHPVETLTFRAEPAATDAYDLVLEWQTTRIRLPIAAGLDGS